MAAVCVADHGMWHRDWKRLYHDVPAWSHLLTPSFLSFSPRLAKEYPQRKVRPSSAGGVAPPHQRSISRHLHLILFIGFSLCLLLAKRLWVVGPGAAGGPSQPEGPSLWSRHLWPWPCLVQTGGRGGGGLGPRGRTGFFSPSDVTSCPVRLAELFPGCFHSHKGISAS